MFDVELSFYKYIKEVFADPYVYNVAYGEEKYDPTDMDQWFNVRILETNFGTKNLSRAQIDIFTRIHDDRFLATETTAIIRLSGILTNTNIITYTFEGEDRVATQSELTNLVVLDNNRKKRIDRILLEVPSVDKSLKRTTVVFNLALLSDLTGGRTI